MPPESSDRLVQNEQGAVFFAEFLDLAEEILLRLFSGCCFRDDAGDLARIFRKELQYTIEVVVAEGDSQIPDGLGNAGVRRGGADEPVVYGKKRMICAKGNHVAPSIRTSQFDGCGCHVRAILRELHHVRVGDHPKELVGVFDLDYGWP